MTRVDLVSLERACITLAIDVSSDAVARIIGASVLDEASYQPLSDGVTLSDWSEDPRLAIIGPWGTGSIVIEPNGGMSGVKPQVLAALSAGSHRVISICWNDRGIHPLWQGRKRLAAYAINGRLAVAIQPESSDRQGQSRDILDPYLRAIIDAKGSISVANWPDISVSLLESLSGAELSHDLVWSNDPGMLFIIDQPPVDLTISERVEFFGE